MRTLQRFATVCFLGTAFAALISACGSSDAAPPAGGGASGAGAPGAGAPAGGGAAGASTAGAGGGSAAGAGGGALTGDATKGATLWTKQSLACNTCHGEKAEGMLGPNITNSSAGIMGWTEAQFHEAVRNSKNRKGVALCFTMPPVAVADGSEQDIADLFAFVMAQTPVTTAQVGSYCAPGGGCTCTGTQM